MERLFHSSRPAITRVKDSHIHLRYATGKFRIQGLCVCVCVCLCILCVFIDKNWAQKLERELRSKKKKKKLQTRKLTKIIPPHHTTPLNARRLSVFVFVYVCFVCVCVCVCVLFRFLFRYSNEDVLLFLNEIFQ